MRRFSSSALAVACLFAAPNALAETIDGPAAARKANGAFECSFLALFAENEGRASELFSIGREFGLMFLSWRSENPKADVGSLPLNFGLAQPVIPPGSAPDFELGAIYAGVVRPLGADMIEHLGRTGDGDVEAWAKPIYAQRNCDFVTP